MALLATGKKLLREIEQSGAIAIQAPLEGGFEGRYIRRLRLSGYEVVHMTARGLGDLSAYLMGIHGVRPAHLGKKNMDQSAVGDVHYLPPILSYRLDSLPPQSKKSKGVLLWLIEGHILSRPELEYLATLPSLDSRIKVVVEVGGDRSFSWQPLGKMLSAA